jgi:hypothetical protein
MNGVFLKTYHFKNAQLIKNLNSEKKNSSTFENFDHMLTLLITCWSMKCVLKKFPRKKGWNGPYYGTT